MNGKLTYKDSGVNTTESTTKKNCPAIWEKNYQ